EGNRGDGGVEHESQVGLISAFLIEYEIEHRSTPLWIADARFKPDFFDQSPFTGLGLSLNSAPAVGPHNVHADLTGGIAAQDGAILTENHFGPLPGCRDCAGDASGPSARHKDIAFKSVCLSQCRFHDPSMLLKA